MGRHMTLFVGAASVWAIGCTAQVNHGGEPEASSTSSAAIVAPTLDRGLPASTKFFVPQPEAAAVDEALSLFFHGDVQGAVDIAAMLAQGHAVWFTSGTPDDVHEAVRKAVREASRERRVPVLVAYNLPFRDCAQYSAGGAADSASYEAWIDAFASALGDRKAVVILEPDSLGIIPWNTTIYGAADWCQPTVTDASGNVVHAPEADPAHRYALLNYAVASIESQAPSASVYLDGTHSGWLGVGEAAYRLATAGVQSAQGFFLNVSNYQPTDALNQYGTWVSECIAAATAGASWALTHFDYCPSQYNPATNYALDYSAAYEATVTAALANMLAGASPTAHFVIDTSRNGNGPLDPSPYAAAPTNQPPNVIAALTSGVWCNPPGAGLGLRPTASTGEPLNDAYLWVKVPGESDGQCDSAGGARGWDYSVYNPWGVTGAAQTTFDPLWGGVDPAAGAWFPAQALQLARDAAPPILP